MVVITTGRLGKDILVKKDDPKITQSDAYKLDFFAMCKINGRESDEEDGNTFTPKTESIPSNIVASLLLSISDKFHPILYVTMKGERFMCLRMGNNSLIGKSETKRFAARLHKGRLAVGIGDLVGDGSCMEQLIKEIAKLNL